MSSPTDMHVDLPAVVDDEPRRSSRKRKQPEKFMDESTRRGRNANKNGDKDKGKDAEDANEEEEGDDDEESEESEEEEDQQPKRRKTTTATTTNGNEPIKRARGRPPKAKPTTTGATAADPVAKRARGRPKTTASAPKPKKTLKSSTDASDGLVRDDNGLFSTSPLPSHFPCDVLTAVRRRPCTARSRAGAVYRGLGRGLSVVPRGR